ncbi:MAG: hypothetical protein HYS87_01990 [Candidatus Colwellbacteria bacterium]|nr:hypothetical protein [Candidatus Colwellbacteria bacterium]
MKLIKKKKCPHCEPIDIYLPHSMAYIHSSIVSVCNSAYKKLIQNSFSNRISLIGNYIEKGFISFLVKFLSFIKLGRFVLINKAVIENLPRKTALIAQEAIKRGYKIEYFQFLNRITNIFRFNYGGGSFLFLSSPLLNFSKFDNPKINFTDKYEFKKFLMSLNLPHPQGKSFISSKSALKYAADLGFPIVVKPTSGSLSRHTTVGIADIPELKNAIRVAKMLGPRFIVEKFIEGDVYRGVVIGNKFVAAARREPPSIVGDGVCTISQLIELKDKNTRKQNSVLAKQFLKSRGVNIETIPELGEKISIYNKVILAAGGDIHDVTNAIHKENIALLERISKLLETSLVGFDFITTNISKPWHTTPFAIIEANNDPHFDMHYYPTSGKTINVAKFILDEVEETVI